MYAWKRANETYNSCSGYLTVAMILCATSNQLLHVLH